MLVRAILASIACVLFAAGAHAQAVTGSTGYVGSTPIRTMRLCSDYHVESKELLKSVEGTGARIQKMAAEAQTSDLVVLRETLDENSAAAQSLAAMGQGVVAQLALDVPMSDTVPSDVERQRGEKVLRQLTVLKDRVTDLYADSVAFKKRLSQDTKQNQVTRLPK